MLIIIEIIRIETRFVDIIVENNSFDLLNFEIKRTSRLNQLLDSEFCNGSLRMMLF